MFTGVKLCTFSTSESKIQSQPANLSSNLLIMGISWSDWSGMAVRDGHGCSTFTTSLASLQCAAPTGPSHLGRGGSSTVGEQEPDNSRQGQAVLKSLPWHKQESVQHTSSKKMNWTVMQGGVYAQHWCAWVSDLSGILMHVTLKAWDSNAVILC